MGGNRGSRGDGRLVDTHTNEGEVSGRDNFIENTAGRCGRRLRTAEKPHPWNLVATPMCHPRILHLSPCRGPALPVYYPQSQPSHGPAHQDGTSLLCGIALQTSRTPHRPLRRTPKTIVNEMDPTSVRSCPLSRTPLPLSPLVLLRLLTFRKERQGPRPGWRCQIAQSEENGSPHMGGFKPRPGVMSLAVAWI